MKYLTIILTLTLSFSVAAISAQSKKINVKKSSIKWTGKKVLGQHEGFVKLQKGWISIEDNQIQSGEFLIDMRSISCTDLQDEGYNKQLVGHLKSDDFFGVENYPTAKLTIKKSTRFKQNKATVTAQLTIKNKTQSIDFEATKTNNTLNSTLQIDRSKFDVRYGSTSFFDSLGDKAIYDIFTLEIQLNLED